MTARTADSSPDAVASAIRRAVAFLRRRQLPHGEFTTLMSAGPSAGRLVEPIAVDSSTFTTCFVVYALAQLDRATAGDMIAKAVAFLRAEMGFGGVWRFWSTYQHKHARLPPDLDDTACASYALRIGGAQVPRNRWAFLASRDDSGRFRTWMLPTKRNRYDPWFAFARAVGNRQAARRMRDIPVPPDEDPRFRVMHIDDDDVDPVVNANVVLYLGERRETLPAIDYVIRTVLDDSMRSIYYKDHIALDHAVARAFRHASPRLAAVREALVARIARRAADPATLTPVTAAMGLSALLAFDPRHACAADFLRLILDTQRDDGGWDAFIFESVHGSEEQTTACCVEALSRLR